MTNAIIETAQQIQEDYTRKTLNSLEAQDQLIKVYDSIYEIIKNKSTGEKHSIGHYLKKHFIKESSFNEYFKRKEAHLKKHKNKIKKIRRS